MTSMAMARPNRAIPAPIGPGLQGQYSRSICLLYVNYDTDAIYACIYNSYLIMFLRKYLSGLIPLDPLPRLVAVFIVAFRRLLAARIPPDPSPRLSA